jgi:hypothetical protein
MLRLFRRPSRTKAPSSPRPVRLLLEALEDRYCPSNITLNVSYAANRHVIFSGQVTPGSAGLTVQISGAASGSTTTDANGNYSVNLTPTSLGQVMAKTSDGQSNTAGAALSASTPTIQNFGYTKGFLNYYTFAGQVTGDVTGGMVITFGGISALNGRTATVDANGNFSITVQVTDQGPWTASAYATDWWGLDSQVVYTIGS